MGVITHHPPWPGTAVAMPVPGRPGGGGGGHTRPWAMLAPAQVLGVGAGAAAPSQL